MLLKCLCILWQVFSREIDVEYFILRHSNLIYFHGKFHEWVEDKSTDENTIGFINYLAVDSDSQAQFGLHVWERGGVCLRERLNNECLKPNDLCLSGRQRRLWGSDWLFCVKGPQPYLACVLNLACEPSLLVSLEKKGRSNLLRKQVQLAGEGAVTDCMMLI